MARKITFEIITRAQTRGLRDLARALEDITKQSKTLNKDLQLRDLGREITNLNKNFSLASETMKTLGRSMRRDLGDQAERAAKNVESFEGRVRDLGRAMNTIERNRRRMKTMGDDIAASEERLADARQRVADATSRLRRAERDPNRTKEQIDDATQAYNDATRAVQRAENQHKQLNQTLRKTVQESLDAERQILDLEDAVDQLRRTKGGDALLKQLLPPSTARDLRVARSALNDFNQVMDTTFQRDRANMSRISQGFGALRGQITQLAPSIPILRNMRTEIDAMARIDTQNIRRAIGSPDAAMRTTTTALRAQNEQAIALQGEMARLATATTRWANAESEARSVLNNGTTAIQERRRVQQMLNQAMAQTRSVESTADKRQTTLLAQQRRLLEEQLDLTNRINAAQAETVRHAAGTAAHREAVQNLDRLRSAYTTLDQAIDANNANLRENATIMSRAQSDANAMARSTQTWQNAVQSLMASSRQNPFRSMIENLQQVNQFAMRAAATLTSRVRTAITTTANAARSFASSAGNMFAGLQRALQSTGSFFDRFADRVQRSMDRSRAAMMEMYAAGFSLMAVGREINQFGVQGFRMMEQSLNRFMEYERMRNVAAIAGAEPVTDPRTGQTSYRINSEIVDQLIFDLQRGTMTPEWLGGANRRLPVVFDARELAEGLYYYSSAIGVEINNQNRDQVGQVVATMMQMAKVTNTGVEEATKGVLNILMEFGYDPRQIGTGPGTTEAGRLESARQQARVAAQVGYLSNISTMEVSDIIETFKMVGPMANILSGGAPGAGLDETFLLAFLASEVGLRGGNTGRGINRALTSLLDPTPKMIEVMGQYFPDVEDEESFRARFFEPGSSKLKGGIMGFMETLASVDPDVQAQMLAELFTENATRTLVGVIGEFTEDNGLQKWLDDISGDNPFEWLAAAAAESANSVSGWFAFMSNGWFQFQSSIIQSIQGPLMSAFQLIGEFLFEFAEAINLDPRIGQVIASIVTAILSLAAVGGTVLMIAGGILLLGRSFAMLGGFVLPFIRLVMMAGLTLTALVPIIAAVGIAVGLAVAAFNANIFGIRDGFEAIQEFFGDFEGNIAPMVDGLFNKFGQIAGAIQEFFNIILLGGDLPRGTTSNLFGGIESIFGPMLGGEIINGLVRLRSALDETRDSVSRFLSRTTFDVSNLQEAGLVIQGFFENLFLQKQRYDTALATNRLGESLGITNLNGMLREAAASLRSFLNEAIAFGVQVASVWAAMGQQIWSNITRIFSDTGMSGVFAAIGAVVRGVATGIITAFTSILGAVAFVTDKIADFAQAMRQAEAQGRTFMGMAVSFEGVLRAIGMAIGLYLGAQMVLAFSPLARILVTVIPLVTSIGAAIAGIAGRFVVLAAQVVIATAAYAAQAAVLAGLTAAKLANTAASWLVAVAQGGEAASTFALSAAASVAAIAMGVLAGGSTLAAVSALAALGPFTALVGILTLIGIVIFAAVAGFAILAGAVTATVGVMLIWVAATEGVSAAFQGLMSFLGGVWAGLQIGIAAVGAFVAVVSKLAGLVGGIFGVSNAFTVLGVVVGVALSGILVIISALGIIAAVAFAALAAAILLPLAPLILLGIAFKALYDQIAGIDWEGVVQRLPDALQIALVGVAEIMDQIAMKVVDSVNTIIRATNALGNVGDWAGLTIPDIPTVPNVNISGEIQDWRERDALKEFAKGDADLTVRVAADVSGEEKLEGFWSMMDKIGMAEPVKKFMIDIGLDPNSMSLSDLTSGEFMDFLETPEGMDFDARMKDFGLLDNFTRYQKDLEAYEVYQKMVARGTDPMMARRFLEANEMPVITARPDIMDYYSSQADALADDEAKAEALLQETQQKWLAAVQALETMSLPDMFSALYDPLAGAGGKSMIGFMAEVGDKIIQNAQSEGGGEWLNMDELLADVAGSGVKLDENLAGRNIHKALEPALQIISDQTGIAMETLVQDIPKFYAPEKFFNAATVDMVQGIAGFRAEFGETLYRELDTLGTDFILPDGTQAEQWGLDWAELNQFAISNAIAGIDWNLADYLSESWGISVAEAEAYLAENGIDADAVSQEWYNGVAEAVRSNAGAYSVMTQEQYEWLYKATDEFSSNVIRMTEEEFAGMSDTMKLILTNMGYTFVLTDVIPPEAMEKARAQIEEFKSIVQSLKTFRGREGADYVMQGDVNDWIPVDKITDATGQVKYVLEDLDGTQVHIPAADWYDYKSSLLLMEGYTEQAIAAIRTGWAAIDKGYVVQGTGLIAGGVTSNLATQATGGVSAGEGPTLQALGLLPEVSVKVKAEVGAAEEDLKAIKTIVDDLGGSDKSTFTITAQTTNLSEAADALKKIADAIKGIPKDQDFVLNADTSNLSEAADALKKMADAIKNIPKDQSFSLTADTSNLSEAGDALKMMADALKSIPSEKTLQISANTSNLSESAAALKTMADAMKNLPQDQVLSITANSVNLTETASALADISDAMNRLQNVPTEISITASSVNLTETASALQDILGAFEGLVSAHAGQMNIVVTATTTNLDETRSALDGIADAMNRISNANFTTISITATTSNLTETRDALQGILDTMGGLVEGHAGQMNLVVTASTSGVDATKESLQSIKDVVTGENSFTVTVTTSGADTAAVDIGNVVGIAKTLAVTWTATITQTGSSTVIAEIGGGTSAAQAYAKTWTATIKESGSNSAKSQIDKATSAARDFAGTYTANLNVNDNATSVINNAINRLDSFSGRNVTSTITTVHREITERSVRTIGGTATAATGGWRSGGQAVLVGEEGPEVVWFPTNGYVFTAPETEQMLTQRLSGANANPFASNSRAEAQTVSVGSISTGDTYNFYGDIKIEDRVAAREFFEEVDRRSGKRVELARRGMRAVDDLDMW